MCVCKLIYNNSSATVQLSSAAVAETRRVPTPDDDASDDSDDSSSSVVENRVDSSVGMLESGRDDARTAAAAAGADVSINSQLSRVSSNAAGGGQ